MSTVVKCASEAEVRRKLQESQADLAKTVHMMLFGVMGSGKSTILNAVAGVEGLFAASSAARSVTAAASWAVVPYHAGHTLVLCDMPGLMDPANDERNGREANVALQALPELKRAYVFVLSTRGGRLMVDDYGGLQAIMGSLEVPPEGSPPVVVALNRVLPPPHDGYDAEGADELMHTSVLLKTFLRCPTARFVPLEKVEYRRGQRLNDGANYARFVHGAHEVVRGSIEVAVKLEPPGAPVWFDTPQSKDMEALKKELAAREVEFKWLEEQLRKAKEDVQPANLPQQQQQQEPTWSSIAVNSIPFILKLVAAMAAEDYLIRRGDTLGGISSKSGVSIARLMQLNPHIKDPDVIFAGHRLRL